MRNGNDIMKRAISAGVAVAVAIGAVLLYRWIVQEIAVATMSEKPSAETGVELPLVPRQRVYSLVDIVPAELSLNIAGLNVKQGQRVLPMPIELAEKTEANQAIARGWTEYSVPLSADFLQIAFGERIWKTEKEEVVAQRFVPLKGSSTCVEEWIVPMKELGNPSGNANPLFDRIAATDARMRARIPEVIRPLLVGQIYFTQLILREAGASFVVTTLDQGDAMTVKGRMARQAAEAGWGLENRGGECFVKENLAAFPSVQPQGRGSVIVYRISDDENYASSKKGTQQ